MLLPHTRVLKLVHVMKVRLLVRDGVYLLQILQCSELSVMYLYKVSNESRLRG